MIGAMSDPYRGDPPATPRAGSPGTGQPPPGASLGSLYQAALGHLMRGRADLAAPAIARLLAAAPADPEVRRLERQAAIIGFACAAERAPAATIGRPPPAQDAIDLVSFHVKLARTPTGINESIDYMASLALSLESAAIRAPDARRILITDEATQVPGDYPVHRVMRFPLDTQRLMFERMRVQALYLREREAARASVLMDSDVVVNADPAGIFREAFDVGLTWRPGMPDAPFNGGVIFVSEGDGGRRFFDRAIACYEAFAADERIAGLYGGDLKAWWGDQFALAALVGYREYAERRADTLSIDGLRVRLFPCADYNFTIEANRTVAELRRKYFVHFKGARKTLQAQYVHDMRSGA
jgi:hypothetical protein